MADYDFTGFDESLKTPDGIAAIQTLSAPMAAPVAPKEAKYDFGTFAGEYEPGVVSQATIQKQTALYDASFSKPEEEAKRRTLASSIGKMTGQYMQPGIIDIASAERELRHRQAEHATRASHRTSLFLSREENAKVAIDDAATLAQIETVATGIKNFGKSVTSGFAYDLPKGVIGAAAIPFDIIEHQLKKAGLPEGVRQYMPGRGLHELIKLSESGEKSLAIDKPQGLIESGIMSGAKSLGMNVGSLGLGVVAQSVSAALRTMVASSGGSSYLDALTAGNTPLKSAMVAGPDAAAEYVTEKLGLKALFDNKAFKDGFVKQAAKFTALEMGGEQAATALQDANKWLQLNPEKDFSEYLAERPAAAIETAIATLVGAGGQIALVRGAERVLRPDSSPTEEFTTAASITEMFTMAQSTGMSKHSPETLNAFFQQVSNDGSVLIDSDKLQQVLTEAGVDVATLPTAAKQLANPEYAGAGIEIPIGELITALGGTTAEKSIVQHLRMDPNSATLAETQEAGTKATEFFQKEAERVMESAAVTDEFLDSASAVETDLFNQLQATGKFNKQVNQSQASLAGAFYTTMASKLGITPTQLRDGYTDKSGVARKGYKLSILGPKAAAGVAPTLEQTGADQTDTPAFKAWFGDSKVVDADSRPLVIYHGTNKSEKGDAFTSFDTYASNYGLMGMGGYFTADPAVASSYTTKGKGDSPTVYPAYLSVKNPIDMDAKANPATWIKHFEDADQYHEGGDSNESWYRAAEESLSDQGIPKWEGAEIMQDRLRAMGHDGITHIGGGRVKSDGVRHQVFIAFDPEQIKSVFNRGTFDPADPNILRQSGADLVAQHNLTADNLLHAMKMGGIAVPSLAVTKKETPLTGFGEITLIAPSEMVDPKGYAKSQVFGADIYSPRYPRIELEFTPAMKKRGDAQLKKGMDATETRYMDWSEVNGPRDLERMNAVMWQFLTSKGIEPPVVRKEPNPLPKEIEGFAKDSRYSYELAEDPAFIDAAWAAHEAILLKVYKGDAEAAKSEIEKDRKKAEARGGSFIVKGYASDVEKYQRDLRDSGKVDESATRSKMEDLIRTQELNDGLADYAKNIIADLAPIERIPQGFTDSGKRKYTPHTLENVVKILKKELRGGEGFNYGVGSLRAKFTPQFKSIDQIRKAKDRLMYKAGFEAVKKEVDDELTAISNDLSLSMDQTIEVLEDAPKLGVERAIARAFKDYKRGEGEASDETKERIAKYLTRLKNLPTEYFEAKILRDVSLSEFKGAVVPEGVDQRVIDELNKRGVTDIRTYKKGDEADRAAKIGEFGHLFFQQELASFDPKALDIRLLANSNLSSFSHELGHFFLTVYADLASQPDAPQSVKDDMNAMLEHLGITGDEYVQTGQSGDVLMQGGQPTGPDAPITPRRTPLETWNSMTLDQQRPYHESIAESWEQYIFTGKAPSVKLQPLFRRMTAWFKQVYTSVKNFVAGHPSAKLDPELAAVFDRMLATDAEIAAANAARNYVALFKSAAEAGMTDQQFAQYTALTEEQQAIAEEELQARGLRDMKWLQNRKNKIIKELQADARDKRKEIVEEVKAEVSQRRVYLAKADLLAAKNAPVNDTTAEAVIADAHEYASVEEMQADIKAAPKLNDVVEGIADQRMIEQYGDLGTEEAIARAADEAIHNDARARMVATELSALATNIGAPSVLIKAAKEYAKQLIETKTSKTLKPWAFAAAETRAGKAALAALVGKKPDRQKAAAEKRTELLNHMAVGEAYKAEAEIRKIILRLRKIAAYKDADASVKTRDAELVNVTRAILAEFGIGSKGKAAREYLAVVRKMDEVLADDLDVILAAATDNAGDWRNVTFADLKALHDTIDQIWHMAKRTRQIVIDGKVMAMQDAADELTTRMDEYGVPASKPGDHGALTAMEQFRIKLQTAGSLLRRVEPWAVMMDGKIGGPFTKYILEPIKIAADAYRKDRVTYRKKYQELLDNVAPLIVTKPIEAPELGYTFGRGHNGIGHAELLHAILHTGNESNKRKLLVGRGWAKLNPDKSLDTTNWDNFLARAHREGILTKEHYDFAQGVWNLLEETKPLAQKAHRAVFGRYFAEVTANSFTTPYGDYAGGYVPAVADPQLSTDAEQRDLIQRENENSAFSLPTTSKGFTKARVENYDRPLLLDLRTIGQHIDKVLLFSHMEAPTRDVTRLIGNKEFASKLDRIDSTVIGPMLTPWLNRSARQIVETPIIGDGGISRVASAARARAGMALMFANVANTMQQVTGFATAFTKLKADGLESHMMRATAQYLSSPKKMAENVVGSSDFMANRMQNEISAINGAINDIVLNPSLYESAQNWTYKHAYFMQSAVDNVMGPIIWTAGYNGHFAKHADSKAAAKYADSLIRQTQGSTLPEDISRLETGPAYARIFTQFIGYFNMMGNTSATALKNIAKESGVRKGAGKMLGVVTMGALVPLWIAETIAIGMRGRPSDEDDDGYLDDWIASVLGMGTIKGAFAMVPFVGQLANAAISRMNTNPADDKLSMSPAVSLLEAGAGVPSDIYKFVTDPDSLNKRTAVRDVASLVNILTGLPAVALSRPIGYMAGVADDKITPTGTLDVVRGSITGAASPSSKQ